MKLGIVGHGFVGTAVDHGFTKDVQKFIVDPKHNSTNTIEDLITFRPDATFVAVPTPQLESGECNTAILEGVMQQLNNCLLYTSPSPRDSNLSRMPSSA